MEIMTSRDTIMTIYWMFGQDSVALWLGKEMLLEIQDKDILSELW